MKTEKFETRKGVTLTINPVRSALVQFVRSKVEKSLRADGLPIDVPTYTYEVATGMVETHSHRYDPEQSIDTLTVEDDLQTRRNFALWKQHEEALATLEADVSTGMMQVYLAFGVDFDMPAEDDPEYVAWLEELEWIDEPVPENERDKRSLYLTTHLLEDDETETLVGLTMVLSAANTMNSEDKALFRRQLRDRVAETAKARADTFIAAISESTRGLDDTGDAVSGDADGEGVEADAE